MYRNINNYYFSRPDYGYAYANPYGMNFSRSYPRVVVYGQQNFATASDILKKAGLIAALAAGSAAAPGVAGKTVGALDPNNRHYLTEPQRVEGTEDRMGVQPGDEIDAVDYVTSQVRPAIGRKQPMFKTRYYKQPNGFVTQGTRTNYTDLKLNPFIHAILTGSEAEPLNNYWPGAVERALRSGRFMVPAPALSEKIED